MTIERPILHGRDHEWGGADPAGLAIEDVGSGSGGGGGIQFDTDNVGGWLDVTATAYDADGLGINLKTEPGSNTSIGLDADGGINLTTHGASMGTIITGERLLFTDPGSGTSYIALQAGHQAIFGAGNAGITVDAAGPLAITSNVGRIELYGTDDVAIRGYPTGGPFPSVQDILRVTCPVGGPPTYHIKAGATWVADL